MAIKIGHCYMAPLTETIIIVERKVLLSETAISHLNYEFLEQFIYAHLSSRSALRDQRDLHVTLRKTLPKHSNSLLYHTKTSKQVSFIFNIYIILFLKPKKSQGNLGNFSVVWYMQIAGLCSYNDHIGN